MKNLHILPLLLGLLTIIACNTTKNNQTTEIKTTTPTTEVSTLTSDTLATYYAGGCFGTCPIFSLTVLNNCTAIYSGMRYSNKLGNHTKQLDRDQFEALKKLLKDSDLFQYPDEYEMRLPDYPSTSIEYYEGTKVKSIRYKDVADEPVKDVASSLIKIAYDTIGWSLSPIQDYYMLNEFVVQLNHDADAKSFVKAFSDYNLELKEEVRNGGFWVMSYDTYKIQPYEMLNKIAANKEVVSVEFYVNRE